MYLDSKNQSVAFQKHQKCSVFIIFECSHDAVSKMYWLECRFQNLPAKNVTFSCEQEAYPSHFLPFSKCASIVRTLLSEMILILTLGKLTFYFFTLQFLFSKSLEVKETVIELIDFKHFR